MNSMASERRSFGAARDVALEATRFSELRRRLLDHFPELDEQTLADTLEGATDLREALAALLRSAQEDECMAKALKERIETLRLRLTRLETRAGQKRVVARDTMEIAEIRKLVEPDFTASLRSPAPVADILNEADLPETFLIPQPPKADKRAILAALNAGQSVPGAVLLHPRPTLSIRSV
jgi:hypothetical protein